MTPDLLLIHHQLTDTAINLNAKIVNGISALGTVSKRFLSKYFIIQHNLRFHLTTIFIILCQFLTTLFITSPLQIYKKIFQVIRLFYN